MDVKLDMRAHDGPVTIGNIMDEFVCGDARIPERHWNGAPYHCGRVKWETPGKNLAGQWRMECPRCGAWTMLKIEKVKETST